MKKPVIRCLVASPIGDVPVDTKKLDFPLEEDPLKTSYRVYFNSITDFLMKENGIPLLQAIKEALSSDINIEQLNEIIVRTEKHGALYHPASIEVLAGNNTVKFGLNVAVTDRGKDSLRKEFYLLNTLRNKYTFSYLPTPYYLNELNSMAFLLEEWFEGYHEFHISKTEDGVQKVKLWEYGKGYHYLSFEQSFEVYKQASKILTLYYDFKDFSQIYPWHHAAGDFVVKIEREDNPPSPPFHKVEDMQNVSFIKEMNMQHDSHKKGIEQNSYKKREEQNVFDKSNKQTFPPLAKGDSGGLLNNIIDVRLTTARGYEPFLIIDEEIVHPALALFYFLLHLSIQMRLDKLDGIGDSVWADDFCVDATLAGFFEALEQKNDFRDIFGSTATFLNLLRSFSKDELRNTFRPLVEQFEHTRDSTFITANLENHTGRLYTILQNFPS